MTYKLNKNISIVLISVLVLMSILCTFLVISNNDFVSADEVKSVYTFKNIMFPFAVTNTAQYDIYFNCYLCVDLTIDFSLQQIKFDNPKLVSANYPLFSNSSSQVNSTIPNITQPGTLSYSINFTYFDNHNYILFSDIPHDSSDFLVYRFSANIVDIPSTVSYFTKFTANFSSSTIQNINRLVITNYTFDDTSNNEDYCINVLKFYDTNNNFLNIGFPVYMIHGNNNFPYNNMIYQANKLAIKQNLNLTPIVYDTRTYFFNNLSDSDINQVSFDMGKDVGYKNGYDEGYKKGVDSIDVQSIKSQAYNQGKADGINSANKYTFSALVSSVVDAPIKAVTGLLNFEIFGVNLKSFMLSLFTLALVIAIIKLFLGNVGGSSAK